MNQIQESRSIRDYLAVLRRRRGVLAAIVLSAAGLGLVASFAQDRVYEAESSIRVKDASEQLNLVGLLPAQGELPAQTAAQAAATVTQSRVISEVRSNLALSEPVSEIQDRVTATQDPRSNLVLISASAPIAKEASDLANAIAETAAAQTNRQARRDFSTTADELLTEARRIEASGSGGSADAQRIDLMVEQAARLEGLGTVTKLADVVQRASEPDSPASPKPIQNSILGGFLGLFVGLITIGVLEAFDRRLRDPEQAHEALDWPILGLIPESVMGGVPVAESPAASHVEGMDAFRMLRTNLSYLNVDNPPHSVLVTSAAPAEGKTTVAMGLAMASAASGRRTLLLEADLHRQVHASRLGLDTQPGLTEYLAGEATPVEVLQVAAFQDPVAGAGSNGTKPPPLRVDCITAGQRVAFGAEMLGSARFSQMLEELQQAYDLVVIDSAPLLAVAETLEIVPQVDAVLFCVRLVETTLEEATAGQEALARLPSRPTGIVVNGLGAEGTYSGRYRYYSYAYSYRFGHTSEANAPTSSG